MRYKATGLHGFRGCGNLLLARHSLWRWLLDRDRRVEFFACAAGRSSRVSGQRSHNFVLLAGADRGKPAPWPDQLACVLPDVTGTGVASAAVARVGPNPRKDPDPLAGAFSVHQGFARSSRRLAQRHFAHPDRKKNRNPTTTKDIRIPDRRIRNSYF